MTVGDIALLALGLLMAGLTIWALWPRPRPRAGPRNNWRQRSGDEVESAKTDATEGVDSPYLIAWGIFGD